MDELVYLHTLRLSYKEIQDVVYFNFIFKIHVQIKGQELKELCSVLHPQALVSIRSVGFLSNVQLTCVGYPFGEESIRDTHALVDNVPALKFVGIRWEHLNPETPGWLVANGYGKRYTIPLLKELKEFEGMLELARLFLHVNSIISFVCESLDISESANAGAMETRQKEDLWLECEGLAVRFANALYAGLNSNRPVTYRGIPRIYIRTEPNSPLWRLDSWDAEEWGYGEYWATDE
ncbi:hypothetical protein HYFRA_00011158 [Hymenoscyphus fraxineus]|uniref:Uncharacterized protein n=1 Tax=Hymenoscyphus fraxineus TaxID=746836 RepID=A0A9N9L0A9_9HELO|nr:hypothetical protein HYFRA_00011158 [Hymenoscyphus fraxineus]